MWRRGLLTGACLIGLGIGVAGFAVFLDRSFDQQSRIETERGTLSPLKDSLPLSARRPDNN